MKKNSSLALALAATCGLAAAQNAPAPASTPAGNPAPAPSTAPGAPAAPSLTSPTPTTQPSPLSPGNNTSEIDTSTASALDYLFHAKPGEGTTAKAGAEVASALADKIKAIDILQTPGLDNPELKVRFQTYLSLPEVPQARIDDYFGKMQQVSTMLKAGDNFDAWKMLYTLGSYTDLDAGISRELASRVENFWNTDRTKNGLEIANSQLRNNIETYQHNADLDAEDIENSLNNPVKNGNNNPKGGGGNVNASNTTNSPLNSPNADPAAAEAAVMPTMSAGLQGKLEMTGEYLNLLEARAKIKLNEMRANKMSDQDRQDFADYIRTLYQNHRYYHVIIAADFYRALFNEGDYPDDLSNQAVAGVGQNGRAAAEGAKQTTKTLGINATGPLTALNIASNNSSAPGEDNQPLSIADEVTSALEINNRVSQSVEVFKYRAGRGDIAQAAVELQDAFVGNEFHPALQGVARDEKEKVGDYLTKLDVLKNQIEVRDFGQVEAQVAGIQKIAADFDATKPLALVNGVKLESRLRLGKARLLAQAGQLADAMEEFQTAAEEWPGNPDLNSSANTFFKTENYANQATTDFDRMVQSADYRGIFGRQLEFALAVKGDSTREQQLKDALGKVTKAEMASEKANMMAINGDVDGAWETVQLAAKDWPDDTKLNKLLATYSEHGADFVSALNKAEDAEAKKEYGYSLTWYVNAQSIYPPSIIANDGIDRLSKQILSPLSTSASSN